MKGWPNWRGGHGVGAGFRVGNCVVGQGAVVSAEFIHAVFNLQSFQNLFGCVWSCCGLANS